MSAEAGSTTGRALGLLPIAAALLLRERLEARLVTHLLVEFPLLLAGGALLAGPWIPARLAAWNRGGATGLAAAFGVLGFFLLPRVVDASVAGGGHGLAKVVLLPVAGAALACSLPLLPWLGRQVLAAQLLAMTAAMGWLYTALPERLCLRYLRSEQDELGVALLLLALAGFLLWLGRLLAGERATARGPIGGVPSPVSAG